MFSRGILMARTNKVRSEEMREALVASARGLFFEKGYAETGTPEIVARAEVTRGALYHHFKDKRDLFKNILELEAMAVASEILADAVEANDPFEGFMKGAEAYFRAMQKPGRVQLLLIDGPNVLGRRELDEIDAKTGGQELLDGLTLAMEHTSATPETIECIAKMLSSAFDRAALEIYEGADVNSYLKGFEMVLSGLMK